MRILKIWGSGSEKKRDIDINIDDWTDFAPDLSEFFSDNTEAFGTEDFGMDTAEQEAAAKGVRLSAQDFEIDWNVVREREDWVAPVAAGSSAESTQLQGNIAHMAQAEWSQEAQNIELPHASKYPEKLSTPKYFDDVEESADFRRGQPKSRKARLGKGKKIHVTRSKKTKKNSNNQNKKHTIRNILAAVAIIAGLYAIAVFSNIPFIEKWRTIYIETAMSTMNHQWLATAFLPPSVINKVVGEREALESEQEGVTSNWGDVGDSFGENEEGATSWEKLEKNFYKTYSEIDKKSFDKYMQQNAKSAIDKNGFLVIDKAGLTDKDTGIVTKGDDRVVAIDTENGITIVQVQGEGYVGKLAIIKDPSRVGLALASGYGSAGSFATDIAKKRKAVLAINASGFFDPEGKGNGGVAHGVVISKGKKYNDVIGDTYKTIALDDKDRLNIGHYKSTSGFRDAVEFKPALIVDGKTLVNGSAGWGVQPRTAIGQAKDGTIFMLVIDGRAPGYSIGATVGECAKILARYGAIQACNLDGGSSSVMVYRGREITKPSAANKEKGRHIPDAFVVYEE